jgi:hypothetical protein
MSIYISGGEGGGGGQLSLRGKHSDGVQNISGVFMAFVLAIVLESSFHLAESSQCVAWSLKL